LPLDHRPIRVEHLPIISVDTLLNSYAVV
jgi:hypothetical protein